MALATARPARTCRACTSASASAYLCMFTAANYAEGAYSNFLLGRWAHNSSLVLHSCIVCSSKELLLGRWAHNSSLVLHSCIVCSSKELLLTLDAWQELIAKELGLESSIAGLLERNRPCAAADFHCVQDSLLQWRRRPPLGPQPLPIYPHSKQIHKRST